MKRAIVAIAVLSVLVLFVGSAARRPVYSDRSSSGGATTGSHGRIAQAFGRLPLAFEPNVGQADPNVRFVARNGGSTLLLTPTGAVFSFRRPDPAGASSGLNDRLASLAHSSVADQLDMSFVGAKRLASIIGQEKLPGVSNYFVGNDPARWHTNVPQYGQVTYRDVYPGIDLRFYGNRSGRLEYDFIVAPGADPSRILLHFSGQTGMAVDGNGGLILRLPEGAVTQPAPAVYQPDGAIRLAIDGRFTVEVDETVGFAIGAYDRTRPLIIDPSFEYGTYLGGSGDELPGYMKVDPSGNAYLYGLTTSLDFPVTPGAFQPHRSGVFDTFVSKLNPTGSALLYSTYLGGNSDDEAFNLSIDGAGNAYLVGPTLSTDFPTTPGCFQSNVPGGDHNGFITKLNSSGTALVWSTYLGASGHDATTASALDSSGNVYVVGVSNSPDFPVSKDAYQKSYAGGDGSMGDGDGYDLIVAKLRRDCKKLLYATFLGGTGDEVSFGMAIDGNGDAYVAPETSSRDYPTTEHAFQKTFGGGDSDAAATKLNPRGSGLIYSTYLGGSADDGEGSDGVPALDGEGNLYMDGGTDSTDFPVTPNAFQRHNAGSRDGTVSKLSADGSRLLYSTYLGGSDYDIVFSLDLDHSGHVFVTGIAASTDFPTRHAFQSSNAGLEDAFVSELNGSLSRLLFSSYLGGSGYDEGYAVGVRNSGDSEASLSAGQEGRLDVYLFLLTTSVDLPVSKDAFQPHFGGGDGFLCGPDLCDTYVMSFSLGGDSSGQVERGPASSTHRVPELATRLLERGRR